MEKYQIKSGGFNEIKASFIKKYISFGLITLTGGLLISFLNTSEKRQFDIVTFIEVLVIALIAVGYGIFNGFKRQKKIFESYNLFIDNNSIIREQFNTKTIKIPFSEVTEISKHNSGSYIITGKSSVDIILIPAQIDHYENLSLKLENIKSINLSTKKTLSPLIVAVLTILLMGAFYISKNKIIVSTSGTILILGLIYSIFEIQKSKNVDRKTKSGFWVQIFIVFCLIIGLYFKLTS